MMISAETYSTTAQSRMTSPPLVPLRLGSTGSSSFPASPGGTGERSSGPYLTGTCNAKSILCIALDGDGVKSMMTGYKRIYLWSAYPEQAHSQDPKQERVIRAHTSSDHL